MSALPHGLGEPLHYVDPAWARMLLLALAAAFVAAILWWLKRRAARAAKAPGGEAAVRFRGPKERFGLADEIEALKQRIGEHQDYRAGCHELALMLREHFTGKRGPRLFTLTAREIGARLADATLGSLFELLSDLQFRRIRPSREDFEGICDLASDSALSNGK